MLLHQVWTQVKHLAGYEQQDAHVTMIKTIIIFAMINLFLFLKEFFIAALNSIHKNCIGTIKNYNHINHSNFKLKIILKLKRE